MVMDHGKQSIRNTPAWEGRARTVARQLGVSEAKVIRQVKRELIRAVAEQIAKDEQRRVRAARDTPRPAPRKPSRPPVAKVRSKKVSAPVATPTKPTEPNEPVSDKEG
jgi:hypothetical protein